MFANIIGILLIVGGIGFGVMAVFAASMDPQARPMGETVGLWPFGVSLAAILCGIAVFMWG